MKYLKYLGVIAFGIIDIWILKVIKQYVFLSFVGGEAFMLVCCLLGISVYESKKSD